MSAPDRVGACVPKAKFKPYLKTVTYQSDAPPAKAPAMGRAGADIFLQNIGTRKSEVPLLKIQLLEVRILRFDP